jgi:hypothetical protein
VLAKKAYPAPKLGRSGGVWRLERAAEIIAIVCQKSRVEVQRSHGRGQGKVAASDCEDRLLCFCVSVSGGGQGKKACRGRGDDKGQPRMKGDKREEEEDEPNPLASYGPGRIIKPVGKQRFRGWEVVAEAKIEVMSQCRHD